MTESSALCGSTIVSTPPGHGSFSRRSSAEPVYEHPEAQLKTFL